MSDKVFNIIIKLSKQGGADTETVKSLVDIKNAMAAGIAVAGGFTAAYYAVDKVLQGTVGKFVSYAEEVKNLQAITGDSIQDTSRMLTVAKDYGLTISDLTMAQKALAKTGQSLSTETFARMSDDFLKLGTGVERTTYLVANFGRSGTDLATILSLGSAAWLQQADAVSRNLVLDEQMSDEAEKLKIKSAELKDQWDAIGVGLGEHLAPELLKVVDYGDKYITNIEQQKTAWMQYVPILNTAYAVYAAIAALFGRKSADIGPLKAVNTEVEEGNTELEKRNGLLASSDRGEAMWKQNLADEADRLKAVKDDAEALRKELVDQTGWEVMYSAAKDATAQAQMSLDRLGQDLQNDLNPKAAAVWEGFLAATGKISPAALEQFLLIQQEYIRVKGMLDAGIDIKIIVKWIQYDLGAGSPNGGGSKYSALHQAWMDYWNGKGSKPDQPDPGYASGADFTVPAGYQNDSFAMRVQSGEHVVVTPAGQASPNDNGFLALLQELRAQRGDIQRLPDRIGTELDRRIK